MTNSRTLRVGAKGQVVIPKEVRDQLGIHPGDEMQFWIEGDHVAAKVARAPGVGVPLRGRFRGHGLPADLLADRAAERRREDGR